MALPFALDEGKMNRAYRRHFLELPSYWMGERGCERREIDSADTSHLDNERISDRVDQILAETEKAYKLRLGSWRIKQRDVWAPKSQVELVTEGGLQRALFPIWLAKKWGYFIRPETRTVKAVLSDCQQCGVTITYYTCTPPPKCATCRAS
jgi:hypothetical protein